MNAAGCTVIDVDHAALRTLASLSRRSATLTSGSLRAAVAASSAALFFGFSVWTWRARQRHKPCGCTGSSRPATWENVWSTGCLTIAAATSCGGVVGGSCRRLAFSDYPHALIVTLTRTVRGASMRELSADSSRATRPSRAGRLTPIGLGKRAFAPRGSGPFRGLSSAGHNPSVTVSNLVTPKITRKGGTCPPLEYAIRS
jgi:hypothetical protein